MLWRWQLDSDMAEMGLFYIVNSVTSGLPGLDEPMHTLIQ
jgi:hypothetical protein